MINLNQRKRVLLGLPIHDITIEELLILLKDYIQNKTKTIVFGISAGAFGRLKFRQDLVDIYKQIDVMIAEGGGIPLLAKLFGVEIKSHIGLVNLSYRLFELANINSYKILLFGGTQETNDAANYALSKKYPNIIFCPGINGYFNDKDELSIVDKINQSNPDILLIGITYPIKERFSTKYKDRLLPTIIIPCGGAFEVFSGKVKRPKFTLKWIPLNWFYRFIQEPIRLFKPVLLIVLFSLFWVFPILYFKHFFHIERNPSIIKFFKISA